jgi:hypothetical protein
VAGKVKSNKPKPPRRKARYGISFDESVVGTWPMRTYRSEKPVPRPTAPELFIRTIAAILSVLLVLRLLEVFTLPANLTLVKALNTLTNPLIIPFRLVFGSVAVGTFFALIVVLVAAPVLIHRFKDTSDTY